MEKCIIALMLILFATNAYAITQEQLEQAQVILQQMDREVKSMYQAVNLALRGNVVGINFTPEQIQEMKNRYTNGKTNLQQLYQELP